MQGLRVVRSILTFRKEIILPLSKKDIVNRLIFYGKSFASEKTGTKSVKKLPGEDLHVN